MFVDRCKTPFMFAATYQPMFGVAFDVCDSALSQSDSANAAFNGGGFRLKYPLGGTLIS